MTRLSMKSLLALSFVTLALGACKGPTIAKDDKITGDEFRAALKPLLSQLLEKVQKQRAKIGGTDLDNVVVVPIDRVETNIQSYLNDDYKTAMTRVFIDVISDQEDEAGRDDLVIEPYDSGTFYRLMQTANVQQIEDLVIPANRKKIAALLEKSGQFVHGFARLILEEGLDARDYRVRIEFVPLNGSSPIRTKGGSIPRPR